MCHEIFNLLYFHDSNPSGPLINRVKYFEFGFDFAKIFEFFRNSMVCIIPRSKAPRSASHRVVSDLPSVCFYDSYFSVMPSDNIMKIISSNTNCLRNLFYFRLFSIKHSWKTSWIWKQENRHVQSCLTRRCASHSGVKLCSVHHTAKSNWKPWSQNQKLC